MSAKRTIGSLTHKDFGKYIQVAGYQEGKLWAVHHVCVTDGSSEPFTRLIFQSNTADYGAKGLPPETPVIVSDTSGSDIAI